MPRIQISPPQKGGAKKPAKAPPAKDAGKGGAGKKSSLGGKGDIDVLPAQPLDEATAAALAPIQFALVREVVVSALNDLDMVFPHTV